MLKRSSFICAAALAAVVILTPGTAKAEDITCTTYVATATDNGDGTCTALFSAVFGSPEHWATGFQNVALPIQGFNSSWGDLLSVTVNATANGTVTTTLTNNNSTAAYVPSVAGTMGIIVDVLRPGTNLANIDLDNDVLVEAVTSSALPKTLVNANSSKTYGPKTALGESGDTPVDPSRFGSWTSSGNVNMYVSGSTYASGVFTDNTSATPSGTAWGQVDVTYTWILNPVPEPITMALLGSGLLLMGVVGRRKMRRTR